LEAKPEARKFSHDQVKYETTSRHPGEFCAICRHYISGQPPGCESVKRPIAPRGWCVKFEQK
jgi:hypothetical protein